MSYKIKYRREESFSEEDASFQEMKIAEDPLTLEVGRLINDTHGNIWEITEIHQSGTPSTRVFTIQKFNPSVF